MSSGEGLNPWRLQGPGSKSVAQLVCGQESLGAGRQKETDALFPLPDRLPMKPCSHGRKQAGGWLTSVLSQHCGMMLDLGFSLLSSPTVSVSAVRHETLSLTRACRCSEVKVRAFWLFSFSLVVDWGCEPFCPGKSLGSLPGTSD